MASEQPSSLLICGLELLAAVLFPDRVNLCGIDICCGRRSETAQKALQLLAKTRDDGVFVAYDGTSLVDKLGLNGGQNGAAGLIRDLRNRITREMLKANVQCGQFDVILTSAAGYCLSEKLSVQHVENMDMPLVQGHGAVVQGLATSDSLTGGPVDVPVEQRENGPVADPVNPVTARREWILEQVRSGRKLRTPRFASELRCSERTIKRDLDALEDQREFVGSPNSGHYRLKGVKHEN